MLGLVASASTPRQHIALEQNVHKIDGDGGTVQYGLSVRVIPYPNDVASVWVYVCAMVPE